MVIKSKTKESENTQNNTFLVFSRSRLSVSSHLDVTKLNKQPSQTQSSAVDSSLFTNSFHSQLPRCLWAERTTPCVRARSDQGQVCSVGPLRNSLDGLSQLSTLCSLSFHLYFETHMSAVTQHVPILFHSGTVTL